MTDAAPAPVPPVPAAPAASDGKTLGIVALIIAFFIPLIGIILGFVARSQSKRAGIKNTPATAAIIVGFVRIALDIILVVAIFIPLLTACASLGPGVWDVNGLTLTCG
jgi:hypothetical protein